MGSRWSQVVVDALDPVRLGHWWAEVLGFQVLSEAPDELIISVKEDVYPQLCFVAVPDPKDGKNRLHLDLTPLDQLRGAGRPGGQRVLRPARAGVTRPPGA